MAYLAFCNNCDSLMWDDNPDTVNQVNVDELSVKLPKNIENQIPSTDGEDFPYCCPNCETDSYLSDVTADNLEERICAHLQK